MASPYAKLSPLSRNPDLQFKDIRVKLADDTKVEVITWTDGKQTNVARCIGTATAVASLPQWADTLMYYRIFLVQNGEKETIVLGSRCNYVSTPHINARHRGGEGLWCYTCWSDCAKGDGSGGVNIPFYLYYRHYDDHVLMHLPTCGTCGTRFKIWDPEVSLQPGEGYLFSAIRHEGLQRDVEAVLLSLKQIPAPS
jgi:hypothetical protein